MSMKTYANSGWVIPKEVLEKEFPEDMKFLSENEEECNEWMQNDNRANGTELDKKFNDIFEKIRTWGKSKGLDLFFDYTCMDEDNDEVQGWLCFCDNAITINPAFKEIGGEQFLWTTYG